MRGLSWLLFCAGVTLVSPVAAQDEAPSLYERGRAALEAKDGPAARRLFRDGLAGATVGEERFRMLLGLALAHELLGEPALAVLHYRAFLRAAETHADGASDAWQARRTRIEEEVRTLEQAMASSHGTVEVSTEPAGARLLLNGDALPDELTTPLELLLPTGPHRLEARLGEQRATGRLELEAGQSQTLTLDLQAPAPPEPPPPVPPAPAAVPAPAPEPEAPAPPPARVGHPALTWTGVGLTVGGGAALVGAAALFGLAVGDASELDALQSQEPTLDNQLRDLDLRSQIASREAASVALTVTGSVMAIGGVVTIVVNETREDSTVALRVAPNGAVLHGRF